MPRPKIPRCVGWLPGQIIFKPRGVPLEKLDVINLRVEEVEALRLADIEDLYQEDAAKKMDVSRTTFQRILKEARGKVATALINGKALSVEGGNYVLPGEARIFECVNCGFSWEEPFGTGKRACVAKCKKCGGSTRRKDCQKGRFGEVRGRVNRWGKDARDERA
ncbi:MAG: DUF134 domain-containing protein [Actinomycetota bacterium]|nr:DUF134 domain-containing protein [Actinomycetota bacterium]